MPLKFILYRVVCILILMLLSVVLIYIECRAIFFQDIHFDGGVIAIFFLLAYFALFFANNFLGLILYKKLVNNTDVSKKEIKTLKIFFFIQLVMQLLSLIGQFIHTRDLAGIVKRMYLYSYPEFYDYLFFEILPLLIILLTFYYEIFTFPLVKAIKKSYDASQNDLNSIGEGMI